MADKLSPAPGTPQTATKANVGGVVTGAAVFISAAMLPLASQYVSPEWAAKCLDASGVNFLLAGAAAVIAAGANRWAIWRARNKPVAAS